MKHMNPLFMLCLVMLCTNTSGVQVQNKARPELFSNASQRVITKVMKSDKAFSATTGTLIKLQFKNFYFESSLASSVKCYDFMHTVLIKSSSFDDSLFSISRKVHDDKGISHKGRTMNTKYAGGYELIKEQDGGYVFNRIKAEIIVKDY